MNFSKIAIIGPGLIGGSIALALRSRSPRTEVAVWGRREEAVREIAGQVSLASTCFEQVVKGADLVVLCTPIDCMPQIAQDLLAWVAPATLVTDVGSVKTSVVQALAPILRGHARFLGSHPMAGSEQTGFEAARADLFQGSVCIITPDADSSPSDIAAVTGFWQSLGCQVRSLSPQKHDQTVAFISHLPHMLAATLVDLVTSQDPEAFAFCGPGFRDSTRIASGSPAMWTDIFWANRTALAQSAQAMIEKLQQIAKMIDHPDQMHEFLKTAKAQRDQIRL